MTPDMADLPKQDSIIWFNYHPRSSPRISFPVSDPLLPPPPAARFPGLGWLVLFATTDSLDVRVVRVVPLPLAPLPLRADAGVSR